MESLLSSFTSGNQGSWDLLEPSFVVGAGVYAGNGVAGKGSRPSSPSLPAGAGGHHPTSLLLAAHQLPQLHSKKATEFQSPGSSPLLHHRHSATHVNSPGWALGGVSLLRASAPPSPPSPPPSRRSAPSLDESSSSILLSEIAAHNHVQDHDDHQRHLHLHQQQRGRRAAAVFFGGESSSLRGGQKPVSQEVDFDGGYDDHDDGDGVFADDQDGDARDVDLEGGKKPGAAPGTGRRSKRKVRRTLLGDESGRASRPLNPKAIDPTISALIRFDTLDAGFSTAASAFFTEPARPLFQRKFVPSSPPLPLMVQTNTAPSNSQHSLMAAVADIPRPIGPGGLPPEGVVVAAEGLPPSTAVVGRVSAVAVESLPSSSSPSPPPASLFDKDDDQLLVSASFALETSGPSSSDLSGEFSDPTVYQFSFNNRSSSSSSNNSKTKNHKKAKSNKATKVKHSSYLKSKKERANTKADSGAGDDNSLSNGGSGSSSSSSSSSIISSNNSTSSNTTNSNSNSSSNINGITNNNDSNAIRNNNKNNNPSNTGGGGDVFGSTIDAKEPSLLNWADLWATPTPLAVTDLDANRVFVDGGGAQESTAGVVDPFKHSHYGSLRKGSGRKRRLLDAGGVAGDRHSSASSSTYSSYSSYSSRRRSSSAAGESLSEAKRSRLPKESTDILKQWILDHIENPYPDTSDKEKLAAAADLTVKQVEQWMINARRRVLSKMKQQKTRC